MDENKVEIEFVAESKQLFYAHLVVPFLPKSIIKQIEEVEGVVEVFHGTKYHIMVRTGFCFDVHKIADRIRNIISDYQKG